MSMVVPNVLKTYSQYVFDSTLCEKYPHKILLAEDNLINQKVACLSLQRFGYECDVAENGYEVIDKLNEKGIDFYSIILMDIQMPELDGISATKKIIEKWGAVPPFICKLPA